MIDIILDCNDNNIFNNKEYNVEEVSVSIADNHEEYRKLAQQILAKHRSEENIIIKINNESISLNKLALALFIESIDDNKTNNVVFKVKDIRTSMEAYKPYIALTIGIKYALRLIKEDIRTSYKDMESLNYLGLDISRDYSANTITFKWQNSSLPLQTIKTENISETLIWVSTLKALSLAEAEVAIEVCADINYDSPGFNREEIISAIIKNTSPWIK